MIARPCTGRLDEPPGVSTPWEDLTPEQRAMALRVVRDAAEGRAEAARDELAKVARKEKLVQQAVAQGRPVREQLKLSADLRRTRATCEALAGIRREQSDALRALFEFACRCDG